MKKVLVISYNFPPVGGGRVIRTLKFVKYLPQFNWIPVVLTVRKPIVPEYDSSLSKDIPEEAEVIRTRAWQINLLLDKNKKSEAEKHPFSPTLRNKTLIKAIRKIRSFIFIPDSRIGWLPFTVWSGYQIIRKRKIDLIYVSGEPFSSFIAGAILNKLTRIPLVLDFRDEWTGFNCIRNEKGRFVCQIEEVLEKFAVKNAEAVISVTPNIIRDFKENYPANLNKFILIPNGYDPSDWGDLTETKERDKFTISYAGTLYENRSPETFLEALEEFIVEYPEVKDRLKVIFLGTFDSYVENIIEKYPYPSIIQNRGFVSHQDCLRVLKNSDLLLLIEDKISVANRLYTGKLFEYLGLCRPILALTGEGGIRDIILKTRSGIVLDYDDIKGIKKALINFYNEFMNNTSSFRSLRKEIEQYERVKITEKLANVFDTVISKRLSDT